MRDAVTSNASVKALWVESLANPGGELADLEALAQIASDAKVPLIVDNTAATPYLCQPIQWGASLVVHSTTKFLSGHGNAMGGCVVDSGLFDWAAVPGKYPSLSEPEDGARRERTCPYACPCAPLRLECHVMHMRMHTHTPPRLESVRAQQRPTVVCARSGCREM